MDIGTNMERSAKASSAGSFANGITAFLLFYLWQMTPWPVLLVSALGA